MGRWQNFVMTFMLLILFSCNKDEIGRSTEIQNSAAPGKTKSTNVFCETPPTVAPQVDFLFIWDNSTSTNFITNETKSAMDQIINNIAERFNYHIMLAPLLLTTGQSINTGASLFANYPEDLSSSARNLLLPNDSQSKFSSLQALPSGAGGGMEFGFTRAYDLLRNNISNGIFRSGSNLIVVILSNEDNDIDYDGWAVPPSVESAQMNEAYNNFISIRNQLRSTKFRVLSLVPHSNSCQTNYKKGQRYMNMSSMIYNTSNPYASGSDSTNTDQSSATPDSYDICGNNFSSIFTSIENTIKSVVLNYIYSYFPISPNPDFYFDPDSLRVFKTSKSDGSVTEVPENTSNGFQYRGYTTVNLRSEPTPGAPYTGHVVQLYGTGKLQTNYDCMTIQSSSPAEYYGYAVWTNYEPDLSQTVIRKNGSVIPTTGANRWEYIGYQRSYNVRIKGPNDYTSIEPGKVVSGYIFKLYGDSIYSNSDEISVASQPKL